MVGGQATFTIGPGADIDVPVRPHNIENAFMRLNTAAATPVDVPMAILSASEWMNVRSKSVQTTYPRYVYLNGDWPVATAYLWPVPNSGDGSIGILINQTLSTGITLDDTENLPPAYKQALRFNLAVLLAPEYGKEASQSVVAQAYKAKNFLSQTNTDVDRLEYDIAGITGGRYWIVDNERH